MACSIEGIQPEFVPPGLLCSDTYCDQLAELLVNESALDELWRAQGKQNSSSSTSLLKIVQQRFFGDFALFLVESGHRNILLAVVDPCSTVVCAYSYLKCFHCSLANHQVLWYERKL